MKEMTWSREEILRRLAIVFHNEEDASKKLALKALGMETDEGAADMLGMARERKHGVIGIIMAADALDIELEELKATTVSDEEADEFMTALEARQEEKLKTLEKEHKKKVGEAGSEGLEEILQKLFG